jgi:hypothetical protein
MGRDLLNTDGDFCQLIVGESAVPDSWRPAENTVPLIPERLAIQAKISSNWARLYLSNHDMDGHKNK